MKRSPLDRKTPLSSSSGLTRSVPLSASVPIQRSTPPPSRRPGREWRSETAASGIPKRTREAVYERDEDQCARCGCPALPGGRSVHHRRPRASGGHADPHALSNLILVHGALGTVGCHGEIEARRPEEYERGYLVRSWADPLVVPVLYRGVVWVLLDDEGGYAETGPSAP